MPDWPHAPVHRLDEEGTYFVTGGTYLKEHFLDTLQRRTLVLEALLRLAVEYGWSPQAWAVLANHYHFVAISPENPETLRTMLSHLHTKTATALNRMDSAQGRRVWYQYWETQLTYQGSYLARLKYTHQNAVHHGVARVAEEYPWCSAAWFARTADPAFRKVVQTFGLDRMHVRDDF